MFTWLASIKCRCGRPFEQPCPLSGLSNHQRFPAFQNIPEFDDTADKHFRRNKLGVLVPNKHWALVGEIHQLSSFFGPTRVQIKTPHEETVIVKFQPGVELNDQLLKNMKEGNVIIIFYAQKHGTAIGGHGVLQETSNTIMAFPMSLKALNQEYMHIEEHERSPGKVCFMCGKNALQSLELKMWKCTKCKSVVYCGRKCQAAHWRESHRSLCQFTKMLMGMARLDFSTFSGFVTWGTIGDLPRQTASNVLNENVRLPGLRKILNSIKFTETDDAHDLLILGSHKSKSRPFFEGRVSDSLIFSALSGLCEGSFVEDSDTSSRSHVVDDTSWQNDDMVLVALPRFHVSFEMPQTFLLVMQLELTYEDLREALLFRNYKGQWQVGRFMNHSYLLKHQTHGVVAVLSSHPPVVAKFGSSYAQRHPNIDVIRVFHCRPVPFFKSVYQEIMNQRNPSNIHDVWIRHRKHLVEGQGSFDFQHEINSKNDLRSLLLDIKILQTDNTEGDDTPHHNRFDFLEMAALMEMLEMRDNMFSGSQIDEDDDSDTDDDDRAGTGGIRCAACRRRKPSSAFSKSQAKKTWSRCRSCVNKDLQSRR